MRVGITLLPELPWAVDRGRWQAVEAYGYDHAWTFDHLAWRSLAGSPWFATVPTLTAAALSTTTLRIGTWVATPNFRHPIPFAKELLTLDHLSGGRLSVGLGAGTDGYDATMLGQEPLTPGRRHARFAEFVEVLGRVLSEPRTSFTGDWYTADDARTVPGCVQRPHPPFVVAANGPRGMRLALERGQAWVTTTGAPTDAPADVWWAAAADRAARFDEARAAHAREREEQGLAPAEDLPRFLNLEARTSELGSAEQALDALGRAAALGYTDAVVAWPRPDGPMAGDPAVLEALAGRLDEVHAL